MWRFQVGDEPGPGARWPRLTFIVTADLTVDEATPTKAVARLVRSAEVIGGGTPCVAASASARARMSRSSPGMAWRDNRLSGYFLETVRRGFGLRTPRACS